MYRLITVICLTGAMLACSQQLKPKQEEVSSTPAPVTLSAELNQWFEQKYQEWLAYKPMDATYAGIKTYNNKLDDVSVSGIFAQMAWQEQALAELQSRFNREQLSDEDKLSYDLWHYQYQNEKVYAEYQLYDYQINQMSGSHSGLPNFLINIHPVDNAKDLDDYIARIGEVGRAINQVVQRAETAANAGIRSPRFAYVAVRDESVKVIEGQPFEPRTSSSPIWQDFQDEVKKLKDAGQITDAQAKNYLAAAKASLVDKMQPAYKNLIAFIDRDMANSDAKAQGVHALPNGEEYYRHALQYFTTTDLTAEQIHQLGLQEVKRLQGEMEALKNKSGFKGDLKAFQKYLRDSKQNPEFYFANTDAGREAYLNEARNFVNAIEQQLPNYFGVLPKAPLVVKRVEAFREKDGGAQHYYPGTPDGKRPGIYYVHLANMESLPRWKLEVIAYHEALPGHHMQLSIAQELKSVPTFRRQIMYNAYAEGWALYAEWLAKEMQGTYATVYADFGRLTSELFRAIRLVVDTGLHAKGWSEQQAVDYILANSATTEGSARFEVQRYLVWPGQATSYKIGMLKIQELRRQAEAELGDNFDIRKFHDVILGGGSMPLPLLTMRVEQWLAAAK